MGRRGLGRSEGFRDSFCDLISVMPGSVGDIGELARVNSRGGGFDGGQGRGAGLALQPVHLGIGPAWKLVRSGAGSLEGEGRVERRRREG